MPRQAPASRLTFAGSRTACSAGSTMYSAAVPKARRHWPFQTHTRSPMRDAAHAVADPVDLAGAVAVRDDARERDLAVDAGAALDVGRIDAGGREPHPHLAASGFAGLDIADAQHLAGRIRSSRSRQHAWRSLTVVGGSVSGTDLEACRPGR